MDLGELAPTLRAAFAVLFGLLALFAPLATVWALVVIWGAYALVDGGVSLWTAATGQGGALSDLTALRGEGVAHDPDDDGQHDQRHDEHEEREQQIGWIRKASKAYGKPVAIIQDLQGPKIRLGDFDGIINVLAGQHLVFGYKADYANTGVIPTQYDLSKKVKRGEPLYLYDGKIKTIVSSVSGGKVHVRAENDGILIKRKGINVPDTDFGGDIITAKDKKDIAYGSTADIDYVALSFVQTAQDIVSLRRMLKNLGSNAKIIAKIETKRGVEELESIAKEADALMVARGDLAIETTPESVPIIQRQIIELGLKYAKPTVVATQMLASMTEAPEPTRAEVSDVATAVLLGADAVMLAPPSYYRPQLTPEALRDFCALATAGGGSGSPQTALLPLRSMPAFSAPARRTGSETKRQLYERYAKTIPEL